MSSHKHPNKFSEDTHKTLKTGEAKRPHDKPKKGAQLAHWSTEDDFDELAGRESLSQENEETDFEVTGRESLSRKQSRKTEHH